MADNLETLIDIRVQGIDNARAARQELEGIGAAAGGGSGGGGAEGAGRAARSTGFAARSSGSRRASRRGFLRQARMGLEALALSATGTVGAMGRLGASLGLFASEGPAGLIALAAVAALAGAYHILTTDTRELEAAHVALAKAIDTANIAHAGKVGAAAQSAFGGGEGAGFWHDFAHALISDNDPRAGLAGEQETVGRQLAASMELRGILEKEGASTVELAKHIDQLRQRYSELTHALAGQIGEMERLRGIATTVRGGGVSPEQGLQATIAALTTSNVAMATAELAAHRMTASLLGVGDATEAFERLHMKLKGISETDIDRLIARAREANSILVGAADAAARAFGGVQRSITQGDRGSGTDVYTRLARGQYGALHEGQATPGELAALIAATQAGPAGGVPIGVMAAGGGTMGITPAGQAELAHQARAADKLSLQVATAIGQGLVSIVSGARTGGVGGAVTGAGSLLSGLASAVPMNLATGSAGLSALGPIGAGVAVGGSLISLFQGLFTSAKPAVVMIDGYSSDAITQQQQIMQVLMGHLNTVISVLSAGAAGPSDIAATLGKLSRTDGLMRIPPGAKIG